MKRAYGSDNEADTSNKAEDNIEHSREIQNNTKAQYSARRWKEKNNLSKKEILYHVETKRTK